MTVTVFNVNLIVLSLLVVVVCVFVFVFSETLLTVIVAVLVTGLWLLSAMVVTDNVYVPTFKLDTVMVLSLTLTTALG